MPRASSPPNCSPPRRSAGPGGTPRCRIWSFVPMRTGWKSGGLPRSRCIPLPSYDRLPSLLHYPEGILASCCSADVHDSTVQWCQCSTMGERRTASSAAGVSLPHGWLLVLGHMKKEKFICPKTKSQCSRRVSTTWMAYHALFQQPFKS